MENNVKLIWNNKKRLSVIQKYDYDVVEKYGEGEWYNLLYHDDNIRVLQTIYEEFRDKFKLIYIDPPYNSNVNYYYQAKHPAYKDKHSLDSYLQSLYERLDLMKGLLNKDGFIVLHLDWHSVYYLKVIMDEIFGDKNFRNEIITRVHSKFRPRPSEVKKLTNVYQTLLLYSKKPETKFKQLNIKASGGGYWSELMFHTRYKPNKSHIYEIEDIKLECCEIWLWTKERTLQALKNYEFYKDIPDDELPNDIDLAKIAPMKKSGRKMIWYYVRRRDFRPIDNLWLELMQAGQVAHYPTEKREKLLNRIIEMLTNEGDLVGDFYCGSGTTLSVAEKLNRKWVGCDTSDLAIDLTKKRILNIEGHRPFKILKGNFGKEDIE